MAGLASDGGLFVPETWPESSADRWRGLRALPYPDLAFEIMKPFVGRGLDESNGRRLIRESCTRFRRPCVTPLVQLDHRQWVLELFHGPTLAFKDVALQWLGRLYDEVLARRDSFVTLVGATSGDTGSAAIEAVRDRDRQTIFIMHPLGRTSEVQRRQMTTVDAPNVHNIAIEGTFDDCQAILKAMFASSAFRDEIHLSGVNSINWARVMPQIVYYAAAALALGAPDRRVSFCVPTGNFGDIFAGYVARRMGLPINRLVIASNLNDILPRVLATGEHRLGDVRPTLSPSMDIQVSSNFERLLFELHDRDPDRVRELMQGLKTERSFTLDPEPLEAMRRVFAASRIDEDRTLRTIGEVYHETGYVLDPHSAVGVAAARAGHEPDPDVPIVTLATAHPAKFPDAVQRAIGVRPELPEHLADLYERPERYETLPNDLDQVMAHIRKTIGVAAST